MRRKRLYGVSLFLWGIPLVISLIPDLSGEMRFSLVGIGFLAAGIVFVVDVLGLQKKWEIYIHKVVGTYISDIVEELERDVSPNRQTLRANLMTVRQSVLPWRKPHFEFLFRLRMTGSDDENIKLNTDQGVCGKAFNSGKLAYYARRKEELSEEFNLDESQRQMTRKVCTIISIPIWDVYPKTGPSLRIVGILNLDSEEDLGKQLFNDAKFKWLSAQANFIGLILPFWNN